MALKEPAKLVHSLAALPRETEWFEFKVGNFDPDEVGEYISALANSAILQGKRYGYLIFGVADATHEIVGCDVHLKAEKVKGEVFENYLLRYLSPRLNVSFEWCLIDGKHVEIACIEPTYEKPVKFKNVAYVRVDSVKRRLEDTAYERTLWQLTSHYAFEDGIAAGHLTWTEIERDFDCVTLGKMLYAKDLASDALKEKFIAEGLILDDLQDAFDVTNLFALMAARDLSKYKTIAGKAPRVIQYKTNTKLTGTSDKTGQLGYAVTFQNLLAHIQSKCGGVEKLLHGVRRFIPAYPEKAIREFLANALIHQDFMSTGNAPLIEIFADKIEFTNPGEPLVSLERIIDAPSKSRNERLSKLMRNAGLCEARGSGVDRALWEVEKQGLAPPLFAVVEGSMVVTMFRNAQFLNMTKEDRIRACYQHASLRYLNESAMSNQTLRDRLGLNKNQSSQASGVIKDTIDAKLIRPLNEDQGNRLARYVPYWA